MREIILGGACCSTPRFHPLLNALVKSPCQGVKSTRVDCIDSARMNIMSRRPSNAEGHDKSTEEAYQNLIRFDLKRFYPKLNDAT